jgi:mannose-6-phosphate isomerase-like protein (cupin superfamily)
MKIVKKNETKEFKNSDQCIVTEYPLNDKDINGAIAKINGRYPDKNLVVNTKCKELALVLNGSGKVIIEGKEFQFGAGDVILIEPNERYYWEGNFEIFMPCTLAWYPEQHQEVK